METSLRCNKCGKPICAKCAVRTPTGYRCKECVRGQQKIFEYRPGGRLLPWALSPAGILSFLASLLVGLISGIAGFFAWFIIASAAPTVGIGHRRRRCVLSPANTAPGRSLSRLPWQSCWVRFPPVMINLFPSTSSVLFSREYYLFVATPVVYTRLSGIQLTR